MGVEDGSRLVGSLYVFRAEVEPVLRRLVLEQQVLCTAVVEYHVHDHLHAPGLCLPGQFAELLVRAQPTVDLEVVRDGIAVVGPLGRVVFLNGVEPDGGDAQVSQIVQVIGNALQVSPVTGILLRAVHTLFEHAGDDVIRCRTVCETVGHDEVEHIGCIEALDVAAPSRTCLQFIGHRGFLPSLQEEDVKRLRLGLRQVDV